MRSFLILAFLAVPALASGPREELEVDALLAKVGREAVLLSDLRRFSEVEGILACADVVKREKPLPGERKALLNAYIDEELFYLDARARKTSTSGQIPLSVQAILAKPGCKSRWLELGSRYSKFWKTEFHGREGESLLVRELEKRVLVEKFRRAEVIPDPEVWRREAAVRYPVKIFLDQY
jgi:hypothetical protein